MSWPRKGALSSVQQATLANLRAPLLSNLSASAAPSVTDDTSKGYSAGSTWVFGGTTYTCTDPSAGAAAWSTPTDINYFADWAELVAAINVSGSTYVGKFANVTNANGGPSVIGTAYTAPAAIATPIADGNGAVYKVTAQGVGTYSVKLSSRPPAAFRVTSVMTVVAAKPTVDGYYIFKVTPNNSLPAGVSLGDIAQRSAGVWSVHQTFASADSSIPVGASASAVEAWQKSGATWVRPPVKCAGVSALAEQIYEFATGYGSSSAWTNVQAKIGGLFFYWGNATGNAAAGLTMIRDTGRSSQPTNINATQICCANNSAPTQDNQVIWSSTAAGVAGSIVSGPYQMLVVHIVSRDPLYKARWRLTYTSDGSGGMSLLAEYWGPAYT
jgi:hypothetical protein